MPMFAYVDSFETSYIFKDKFKVIYNYIKEYYFIKIPNKAYEKIFNVIKSSEKWTSKPQWGLTSHPLSRMAALLKKKKIPQNNKYRRECEQVPALIHSWLEYKMEQPLQKTVLCFLKKLKIELPFDLATLLLDIQ